MLDVVQYVSFKLTHSFGKNNHNLKLILSNTGRHPKKKRGVTFFRKEIEFVSDVDKLLDIYCTNDKQRRKL